MRKYILHIITAAVILIPGIAAAQQDDKADSTAVTAPAKQDDTTDFNRVVVSTGNIRPTSVANSVLNVRIINAQTIERQGSFNLKDLLIKENNIRVGNDNILGSSISLQGISGQNVKILMDGIPLTGRENGNIDLGQINLNNIERVEIIEGPLSVIYGTDALGGVINLVSKRIVLDSSKPYLFNAYSYLESIGQYNLGASGVVKVKEVDFGASINRNFFDGLAFSPGNRVMFWKPKQQVFGNFSITRQTGNLKIRFKTDLFTEKIENRGIPVVNHMEAYAYDEYYITNRNITSLSLEQKINSKSFWNMLNSFSFYQRDKVTYRKDLTLLSNNMEPLRSAEANSTNSFLNFMSRGSFSSTDTANDLFSYQVGYDINLNSAFGTKIEADKGHMNDYALFACAEIKPTKYLDIKPGFRATYNTKYPAPFIPSIQMMYTGVKNFSFRYSYGRGFRAPSLKELYLYFVDYNHNILGNPDLASEMSDNHNASVRYKKKLRYGRQILADNSYYFNQIYNQIALVTEDPVNLEYTYRNIDFFRSIGTNMNFTYVGKALRMTAGGSYMGIYNNAFEIIGKSKYMFSPELRLQATYKFTSGIFENCAFSIFHKYVGSTFGYALDNLRNVVSTASDDYTILDVTVNRPIYKRRINLTCGVKNLLNITTINSTNIASSFHGTGSNTTAVSVGRSIFFQMNFKI